MLTRPVTVRDATIEDVAFIKEMMWEAILVSPVLVRGYGLEAMRQRQQEHWDKWLKKLDPVFIAMDANAHKLGALSLRPYPNFYDRAAKVWEFGLGVAAEVRRQGVGQLLIEHALDYCRNTGSPYLVLTVDPANREAQALYRKMGFLIRSKRHGIIEMRHYFEALPEDDPHKVARRRYFLEYWSNRKYSSSRHRLHHCSPYLVEGRWFKKLGLKAGDFVYVVTVIKGGLHLVVKYEVERLLNYEEAIAEFPKAENLDPQADQLTTEQATLYSFEPPLDAEVTRILQLVENGQPKALPFKSDGFLDGHKLSGAHEITPASARLLDGYVEDFRIKWRQD